MTIAEKALKKACKVIINKTKNCPLFAYGWEHPEGCDAICDGSMWDDSSLCWEEYFLDIAEKELSGQERCGCCKGFHQSTEWIVNDSPPIEYKFDNLETGETIHITDNLEKLNELINKANLEKDTEYMVKSRYIREKSSFDYDMTEAQDRFLHQLYKHHIEDGNINVLDLGCGDGRDMKRFLELGLKTYGNDNDVESLSKAIDNLMNEENIPTFIVGDMMELNHHYRYHGIWACASLLHLDKKDILLMFCKIWDALKKDGVFYFSFKEGKGSIVDEDGRHFTLMTKDELEEMAEYIGFEILDYWENKDYRDNDKVTNWLNFVVKKVY